VHWRDGNVTTLRDAPPNQLYEISEESSVRAAPAPGQQVTPIFQDVSALLNHKHQDQPFDDFQRQPLLPRKFSNLGPGLAWYDCDGDGWEDLVVGSGRTGRIAVFQNRSGHFQPLEVEALCRPGTRDRTSIIGWQNGTNRSLLIGSANYEDGLTNGPAARQFNWNRRSMDDSLPGFVSSSGPLAMADADGDGDLDLFLGARITAARYPEAASSKFFRNESGTLVLDETLTQAFRDVGLVSAATWSDLDGDGTPELLLACDGGPIRVFTRKNGAFAELTGELGLANWFGPWNSIATGDFDNDGRLDIVAGNWGRNTVYSEHRPEDWHCYYAPQDNGPSVVVIEAYFDSRLKKIVPSDSLEALAAAFPNLLQRYPTFASFSTASVSEILGEGQARFRDLGVHTFDSTLFLNRGTNFMARPLPLAVQFSPVFGIAVGDVNADGNEDLFLAQNFFGLKQNSRYDAGRGSLLLGNGAGDFTQASAEQAGIIVEGEARAAAFCDYDHDGKLDLAVTQNSGATRLFHNNSDIRGLRIVLRGSAANPEAIGASVRLQYADLSFGPRHEVHAGEGYWSQAGGAVVLGRARQARALEVRSPGGTVDLVPLGGAGNEISVQVGK